MRHALILSVLAITACAKPEPVGVAGPQGPRGSDGTSAAIEVITPCPNIPGAYPEVLLKSGGKLFAVYASGSKIHMTALVPGNYVTTDGRNCNFAVTANMEVI